MLPSAASSSGRVRSSDETTYLAGKTSVNIESQRRERRADWGLIGAVPGGYVVDIMEIKFGV